MKKKYDILILGGGPIAASTAYFLTLAAKKKKIGLVRQEPLPTTHAAYQNAGGCINLFWPEKIKAEMTSQTAAFVRKASAEGADLSYREDPYLFLDMGKHVPAINVSGKKLVDYFLKHAVKRGLTIHSKEIVKKVTSDKSGCIVQTDKNEYEAKKVLLALGAQNTTMVPGYHLEKEHRYLFVLNLPVGEHEKNIPHTIIPVGKKNGVAYIFVKKLPEGWRFVLGQEDVFADAPKKSEVDTYFKKMLADGLGAAAPFLKAAKVERLLEGIDADNKLLKLENKNNTLFIANCGSAVRSCVWLGKAIAKKLR